MWKIRQQDYGKIAKWRPVPSDEIKSADFEGCFLQSPFTLEWRYIVNNFLFYDWPFSFTYCKKALYSYTVKFGLEDFNAGLFAIPSLLYSAYRRAGSLFCLCFGLLGCWLILCLVIPVSVRRGFKLRRWSLLHGLYGRFTY